MPLYFKKEIYVKQSLISTLAVDPRGDGETFQTQTPNSVYEWIRSTTISPTAPLWVLYFPLTAEKNPVRVHAIELIYSFQCVFLYNS